MPNKKQTQLSDALQQYHDHPPETVHQWKDPETGAVGYLVVDCWKNGAAGGGTRVHESVTLEEVTSLAKTMGIKFLFSGPNIGGAKSGIQLDPNHPKNMKSSPVGLSKLKTI